MYWHGWDSFPSGLLPAVWQWVESVPAVQSTLCTAARTHCTTPLTLTTFRQTKSHSRLTTIMQHKTQTKHKDHISLCIEDSTSTRYVNYLLSLCRALFVTEKFKSLWLLGLIKQFQNGENRKRTKFATKSIRHYPSHLSHVQGWQVSASTGLNLGLNRFKPSWQEQVSTRVSATFGRNCFLTEFLSHFLSRNCCRTYSFTYLCVSVIYIRHRLKQYVLLSVLRHFILCYFYQSETMLIFVLFCSI